MWQRPLVTGPIHLRFKNLSGKKGGGVSTSAVSSISRRPPGRITCTMVKHSVNWIVSAHPVQTTPKRHGFLMIKLAAFQANSAARMKLRLPGNREEIERRTSNAQDRTSIVDGFIKSLKTFFGVIPAGPVPDLIR